MTSRQRIQIGFVIIVIGLMVLAVSSRMPAWESNTTLWGSSLGTNRDMARPNLNYGKALLQQGDREGGILFLVRAGELAQRPVEERGPEIRAVVRQELLWLSAFGDPVCSRPDVRPHC